MSRDQDHDMRLITPTEAAELLGLSVPALRTRSYRDKNFPRAYKMGASTVRYRRDEIMRYIRDVPSKG